MTTPVPPQTVEDRERERAAEYGKYVAVQPIQINGVNAFGVGDPVPVGHVEDLKNVPRDAVRTVSSKAGQQAVAASTDTSKG